MTMTTDDDAAETPARLTKADQHLVRLLARGYTYGEAGEVLGLSKATIYRRMQDPALRAERDRWRAVDVDTLLVRSMSEAEKSLTFLAEVRDDDNATLSLRVKCATELVANVVRWKGQDELPRRSMTPQEAKDLLVKRLLEMR